MTVTVLAPLYGTSHDGFVDRWRESVNALERKPDQVLLATPYMFGVSSWKYPTAFYLDRGIRNADSDWVWILGIDDLAFPDALNGIDDVKADVWQMGYWMNGQTTGYLPPQMTGTEFLTQPANVFCACSAVRREAYLRAGGLQDVRLEDWSLWRRLAASGATFEASGRAHYRYMRHDLTRTKTEMSERLQEEAA